MACARWQCSSCCDIPPPRCVPRILAFSRGVWCHGWPRHQPRLHTCCCSYRAFLSAQARTVDRSRCCWRQFRRHRLSAHVAGAVPQDRICLVNEGNRTYQHHPADSGESVHQIEAAIPEGDEREHPARFQNLPRSCVRPDDIGSVLR